MSDLKDRLSLEELTHPSIPSDVSDYMAWKEQKIRRAKESAKNPSNLIPAAKVWKILTLER